MKYLLLIYGNQERWDAIAPDAWRVEIAKYEAYNKRYRETRECLASLYLIDCEGAERARQIAADHDSAADL